MVHYSMCSLQIKMKICVMGLSSLSLLVILLSCYSAPNFGNVKVVITKDTRLVRWTRYKKTNYSWTNSPLFNNQECSVDMNDQHLLDSVPESFQTSLLSALPLDCHPGPQGVFKQRHAKFLNTLAEYASQHSKMKSSPSSGTLIWWLKESNCGLADRLRGITFSLLLALFSHRRLIIMFKGDHVKKYVQPNMIDWEDEAAYRYLREKTNTNFTKPVLFRAYSIVTSKTMASLFHALKDSETTNIVLTSNLNPYLLANKTGRSFEVPEWVEASMNNSGLSGLSNDQVNSVMGIVVRFLFRFDKVLFKELCAARNVLGLPDQYTALHVRTGFVGMSNQEIFHKKFTMRTPSHWKANFQLALSAADRSLDNTSLIFLATDSTQVKELAMKLYPHHFRTLDRKLVHFNQLASAKLGREVSSEEKEEGSLTVWIELFLMAQASTLVKANSGFSAIAGFLCGLDRSNIFNV